MNPTGSTYLALENAALKDYVMRLRGLCARAADALEGQMLSIEEKALVKELRKAAQ